MTSQTEKTTIPAAIVRKRKMIILALVPWILLISCQTGVNDRNPDRIRVIFDTDMGADIDDALALAMLYHYMDMGWIEMMAVMSCKDNPYSARFIDIMNHWYGYPDLPIGIVINGVKHDTSAYARLVTEMKTAGEPVFPRSLQEDGKWPVTVRLYRKLLSESPDSSVVIIATGQSTNLARLINSEPDEYAPVGGLQLVARKVDYLCMMAGNFRESRPETNIFNDSAAAARVLACWPTEIWFSPYDVGLACPYPGESIQHDFSAVDLHPLAAAYRSYQTMPYDRPAWDLTSVLFVAERDSNHFSVSPPGKVSLEFVPDLTHHVVTRFNPDPQGKHRYLSVDEKQAARIRRRLVEMVTMEKCKN